MPNHIKNKLDLIGSMEDVDSLIKTFSTYVPADVSKTDDEDLIICKKKGHSYDFCWLDLKTGRVTNRGDLNQIGLPSDYEIEIKDSFLHFPDFTKVIPPPDDPVYHDEPSQDKVKHLPNWWYTWNNKNWGTKWNAYACERLSINQFTFETAWASVPKIIEVISLAYPLVTIKYSWADEDTGHNCGRSTYRGGLLESKIPKGGSREAYELAFELRPDRAENYTLIGDGYKYIEE